MKALAAAFLLVAIVGACGPRKPASEIAPANASTQFTTVIGELGIGGREIAEKARSRTMSFCVADTTGTAVTTARRPTTR